MVFLARSPKRVAEREKHAGTVAALSGQGLSIFKAIELADAIFNCARGEQPTELGALKIFNKIHEIGPRGQEHALDRLRNEIAVLSKNKSGLPKLLESEVSNGWIITEYFPLRTLERNLAAFTGNAIFSLLKFRSLVETVAELHKEGIVHRDIKPANVFVGTDRGLILGDFGIVFLPGRPNRLTFTNESVGPNDYMPPWAKAEERLDKVKPNFDVYMLGKLLWCMVAGRLKLLREYYRKSDYDLTVQFPNDPKMHMINAILDKCVVESQEKCLPAAQELLLVVDEYLNVMLRGGLELPGGVDRPCKICGKGLYRPAGTKFGKEGEMVIMPRGSPPASGALNSWQQEGAHFFRPLICDACNHVELFMIA